MIIINKRKVIFIISAVLISFVVYGSSIKNENVNNISIEDENITVEQTKLVNTMPVTNKVIIVDAGHGNPDGGAVGNLGTTESEINLQIALKLQKLLEESGATVLLTRSDENGIYDNEEDSIAKKKVSDIQNRVKLGNESSADIFVSIHLNKIEQNEYSGWQTFYNEKSEGGKRLSESIQNALNETISKENTRVPKSIDNVYILKHVEIPTTIVECGFLSNNEEETKLKEEEYQQILAYGIYMGIMDYFYE